MAFPSSPINGQVTVVNNVTYIYESAITAWTRSAPATVSVVTTDTANIVSNTTSTSTTTGALKVAGGVGIVGNVYAGNFFYANGSAVSGAGGVGYTGSAGTGYTGSAGSAGTTGYTGSVGNAGTTGYTGSVGDTGTTGYTGSAGSTGTTGYTGSAGSFTGTTSSAIVTSNTTASTSTTTGALQVAGGAGIAGDVNIGGVSTFTGNIAFNGAQVTHFDSIIDLHTYGNLAPWASDDGRDIGLRMHHYNGGDTLAFLGLENTTKSLQFLINATETSSNVTGTFGNMQVGSMLLSNTTSSTSTTTGALQVAGGVGVAGNMYANAVYTNGLYWASNSAIISTSGGGGGSTNRVITIADGTSVTINGDTTDLAVQINTQVAGTLTINAITGTLVDGQKIMFRLKSANVQTFSWNAVFDGSTDLNLPTVSSGGNKYDYMGFIYNLPAAQWNIIAKNFGF